MWTPTAMGRFQPEPEAHAQAAPAGAAEVSGPGGWLGPAVAGSTIPVTARGAHGTFRPPLRGRVALPLPGPSKPSLSAGLHRRLRIARADATASQLGALQLRLRVVFHVRISGFFDPNSFRRKGDSGYSQRRALSSRGPSKKPEHAPSESGPHSESRGGMLRALAQPPDWPSAAARGSSRATACPADRQRRFRFAELLGHTGRAPYTDIYRHTDIKTYRHTNRHTDRQT
jgi:hypothetical protein